MTLYPHQIDLVARVDEAFASGARAVCLQGATGIGKTHTVAEVLSRSVGAGRRALFIAHLDSLIEDTHARLTRAGVYAGFVQAGRPSDPLAPVQVCSLATLHRRGLRPPSDLLVFDECHRIMAASARMIAGDYPTARILGITATPARADSKPLGDVFDKLVCGPQPRWLTDRGFLVPCDVIAPDRYQERALAMDPIAAYARFVPGARAIVFATNVAHAADLAERFRAAGVAAECVVGDTSPAVRRTVRERMTVGDLRVLVGVGVFIEGFDLPAIEAVMLARGFSVTGAFLQAIGRGLRPSPATGKTRCTVVDLRGSVHLHGLPDEDRVWSLDGAACRRAEPLLALRRCSHCLAIFRPAARCPRCGATLTAAPKVPRVLTRAERLSNLSELPQHERDRRYLAQLERVARDRIRLRAPAAMNWAVRAFEKRFGRTPTAVAP